MRVNAHFASSLLGNFKSLNYKHSAPSGAQSTEYLAQTSAYESTRAVTEVTD